MPYVEQNHFTTPHGGMPFILQYDRSSAELAGGPLDGLLLEIDGRRAEEVDDGVALTTEPGRWPGGRVLYGPRSDEAPGPAAASTTPAIRLE